MRKYDSQLEKNIRLERLVREWTRSGLLETSQRDGILRSVEFPVRRTNLFLRLILFGFTLLLIVAAVFLVAKVLGIESSDDAVAVLCLVAAGASLVMAELLVSSFDFYRFGIEEAAACSAACLAAVGAGNLASTGDGFLVGLIVGALCAFGIYLRFGYVYAALASMICVSAIPFQFHLSESSERILAAASLAVLWAIAHWRHRVYGDEYPGDEVRTIAAIGWLGLYAFLNVYLSPDVFFFAIRPDASATMFYWFTYVMVWVLPAFGLLLAVRRKDRPMFDVSIATALVTLITNKSYLHGVRHPWDPIVFGVLLIGVAVLVKRWLDGADDGHRDGFTSKRLLSSDKRRVGVVSAAAFVFQPGVKAGSSSPPEQRFDAGGGRSGGAGASGSF
jgi:hypothetical protein